MQTYVGIRVKYIFLLDFNQNWSVCTDISKNLQYKISRKSVGWDGLTLRSWQSLFTIFVCERV